MADLLIKKDNGLDKLHIQKSAGFLFSISLTLFLITVIAYTGLIFINKSELKTRDELVSQVSAKEEELRPELLNQIFSLQSRLKNMQILLSGHTFPSNVLSFLEANTMPKIQFTSFNLDLENRKLQMNGLAASYTALTEQIVSLERNPSVEKVEFGGLTLSNNNLVAFQINIFFKPSLFKSSVAETTQ